MAGYRGAVINNTIWVTAKATFVDDPGSTVVDYLTVPGGHRLETVFLLHDDGAIPTGGTMLIERREVGGVLVDQLNADAPIELDKLDAAGTTLSLTTTAGVDSDSGNVAAKLTGTYSSREFAAGELLKISAVNLACGATAKLHIWGRCVRIS